jgi:hypothetical protein
MDKGSHRCCRCTMITVRDLGRLLTPALSRGEAERNRSVTLNGRQHDCFAFNSLASAHRKWGLCHCRARAL